jgi:hypothetical protein
LTLAVLTLAVLTLAALLLAVLPAWRHSARIALRPLMTNRWASERRGGGYSVILFINKNLYITPCHCEEQSGEAIQFFQFFLQYRLLRFARNDTENYLSCNLEIVLDAAPLAAFIVQQ